MAWAPNPQGVVSRGKNGGHAFTLFNPHRYGAYGGQWAQGADAPFRNAFGNSMGTMNNLGGMVGNAFAMNAAMNSQNRQAMAPYQLKAKMMDRMMPYLSRALNASFGNGGGSIEYRDRHSRQGIY